MKKVISLMLSLFMLISITAGLDFSANADDDMIIPYTLKGTKVSCGFDCLAVIDENSALWTKSSSGSSGGGDSGSYHNSDFFSRIFPYDVVEIKTANIGYNTNDSVGYQHGQAAALCENGKMWIWGQNRYGTLGNGSYGTGKASNKPLQVNINEKIIFFDVSGLNSAAVTEDGSLYIWGANNYNQVLGSAGSVVSTPTKVMDNVKKVSLGFGQNTSIGGCVAAIKNDGSLWMWGWNYHGNVGVEHVTNGSTITEPVKVLDNVKAVSLGFGYSFAVKNDNTLWAWGNNNDGVLGTGGTTSTHIPQQIMTNVKSVSAGYNHVLALKNNGTLYSWGNNSYGQLGNESTTTNYMPSKIMEDVIDIDAGYRNSVALKEDGTVWNWGITDGFNSNYYYNTPNSTVPVQIDLSNKTVNYKAEGNERQIDIAWNDKWLEDNSAVYNHDLAVAGIVLSTAAENNNTESTLNKLGFSVYNYNYSSNDIDKPACSVGYKIIYDTNGEKKIDLVLVCCGTRYDENIFENGDIMTDIKARNDGFLAPGKECYNNLNKAITSISSNTGVNITADNTRVFITGHSLGGACANVVTMLLADKEQFNADSIYMYTYASPKVCVDWSDFKTRYSVPGAFNILNNSGDIVHYFWNFSYTMKTGIFGEKYITQGLNSRMGKDIAYNNLKSDFKFRAHAATLYGQQYDDLFSMLRAHYSTTYFAALLAKRPIEYAAKTFRLLSAHCPVDVAVYDADGNSCGYTKDGVAYNDNISPIRIVVMDNEKFIEIPDDGNEYIVKYTGTDDGTMKIQDQIYDLETGEVESEKVFEGVVLEEGKQFESAIDAEDTEKTDLYVIDDDGDKISSVDINGAETDLYTYDITEHNIQIGTDSYKYDGTAKTQNVSVEGLTEGTDYRVIYDNNVNVGTATVTVKGVNYYYGRESKTFKIYDEGTCNETVSWKLSPSGALTITGNGEIPNYDAESPAPWSANASSISKIVINDGVTAIGNNAFAGCDKVSEIFIPLSVKSIGDNATDGCANLKSINYTGTNDEWNSIIIGEGNTVFESTEKTFSSTESGHIWDAGVVTRAATCLAEGEMTYTCTECNITKTVPIATIVHSYETKTTDPTCTAKGFTTYTCAKCGDTYVSDYVNAKGHSAVVDKAVPATFKATGKTAGSHCSVCGKVIKSQKSVAKLGAAKLSKITAGKKQFKATWKSVKNIDGYQIQYSTSSKFKSGNKTITVKGYKSTSKIVKKLKAKKKYYVRIRAYKTINGKKQYSAWSSKKSVTTKK